MFVFEWEDDPKQCCEPWSLPGPRGFDQSNLLRGGAFDQKIFPGGRDLTCFRKFAPGLLRIDWDMREIVMELEPIEFWRKSLWTCADQFYANLNVWFLRMEMSPSSCSVEHCLLPWFVVGSENREIWEYFSLWGNIQAKSLKCNVKPL